MSLTFEEQQCPICGNWTHENVMPLGRQKAPVLIARMKTGSIVIQVAGVHVEIPKENARDASIALMMCLPDDQ